MYSDEYLRKLNFKFRKTFGGRMSENFWKKVAIFMVNVGKVPFPISDNLINFIQAKLTEEQAKFILIFKNHSINLEQIKKKSDLSEVEILKMLENLMDNGIIAGYSDEKTGIINYTLMALFPGIIEYTFAKGDQGEKGGGSIGIVYAD